MEKHKMIKSFQTKIINCSFLWLLSLSLITGSLLPSCKGAPEPFASEGITTYAEATKWVQKNYRKETVTPDSSLIHKMVYFPEGEFMLIHFQSSKRKGYLYHRVPKSLWTDFKNAPSANRFYESEIKGNKSTHLKLKK